MAMGNCLFAQHIRRCFQCAVITRQYYARTQSKKRFGHVFNQILSAWTGLGLNATEIQWWQDMLEFCSCAEIRITGRYETKVVLE